jgi:hypothetical protein
LEKEMDVNRIVSELDAEISRLQKIRTALTGLSERTSTPAKGKRGRPKGSKNLTTLASALVAAKSATKEVAPKEAVAKKAAPKKGKRKLTPEGRKRIADAMKRRWAAHRKAASK